MRQFGLSFGTAYQIYDDCVDLFGTEAAAGKSLGTDLAKGKLTLRGVTKEVEFQLTARLSGGALVVKASTQFAFADFSIPKPQSFLVLSIADTGTIEAQLTLARS